MQFSALVMRSIKSRILVRQIISNHKLTFTVRTLTSQRDAVVFNDGREGWMVEKKGSWYSINVLDPNGQEKLVKARKSEFKVVSTPEKSNTSKVTPTVPVTLLEVDKPVTELRTDVTEALPFELLTTQTPSMHALFEKWVIFSDLHVKGASIEACEEVLDAVHKAAVERNAGIIFLGDFWHVRGSLSVELLNRVLLSLRKWTQPVIMIPGNHDQVTLGGTVHALTPLLYAFRPEQILMISEPTVCMGALWIPYRRDAALMRSILAAGATHPDVSIIYCHADVQGAMMNDGMRSREGLDIASFPGNLPIYSGHFHKPHTMTKNQSSLRYVGSPYQTSLSEAGQDKFLYCMSCLPGSNQWSEESRWTISIGKKYIKATSVQDADVHSARPGDRVVVPVRVGEDFEAEALSSRLRDRGVEVELRPERNALPSGGAGGDLTTPNVEILGSDGLPVTHGASGEVFGAGDDLDPLRVFGDYMGGIDLSALMEADAKASKGGKEQLSEMARLALHSAVLEEGRATIERLMSSEALGDNQLGDSVKGSRLYDLKLDRLSLRDFGPYGGAPVEYPLSDRGLVLIRGQSTDGTGADSNGSGKTTLAMSVMWALSGSLDARLVADGRAADVAYDSGSFSGKGKRVEAAKRTAEVALWGSINDKPFELVRRRGGKKSELLFTLDGRELTTQSVKDTQLVVDTELGIGNGLLQRCCFFGQHSHTLQSLLGLTDVKLKNELSALVNTDIWTTALQDVKTRDKQEKKRSDNLVVEARVHSENLNRIKLTEAKAVKEIDDLQAKLAKAENDALEKTGQKVSAVASAAASQLAELTVKASDLRRAIETQTNDVIVPLRAEIQKGLFDKTAVLAALDTPINQLGQSISAARTQMAASTAAAAASQKKVNQLTAQLSNATSSLTPLLASINEKPPVLASNLSTAIHDLLSGHQELSADQVDSIALRKTQEAAMALQTSAEVRLKALNKSLTNILELKTAPAVETSCATHGQDQCPTCGQDMPAGSRESREAELRASIAQLTSEKAVLIKITDLYRKKYDAALRLKSALEQSKSFEERLVGDRKEAAGHEAVAVAKRSELTAFEAEAVAKKTEREAMNKSLSKLHTDKSTELAGLEKASKLLEAEARGLRDEIDAARKAEALAVSTSGVMNAEVLGIKSRIEAARNSMGEKAGQMLELEGKVAQCDRSRRAIADKAAVMERLAAVLGPRGVQNYVFQGVLRQIEGIANAYLTVLADGGIQLTLQGEEDADKIIKSVVIRGASDGIFKERGLSQLSGGQWRRVSMALDLAFAEVIRRRGILRSNLIVMDEVLTHLDASGREAVGTVLRAMVEGPRADDDPNAAVATDSAGARFSTTSALSSQLLGGGAYGTVIVILQDLAAVELEEAFDCVDVVVKEKDTARVVVDDGH